MKSVPGCPGLKLALDRLWSEVDEDAWQTISTQSYASGVDAVIAANFAYAGWDGLREALQGSVELPDGVTLDEFARAPDDYRAQAKVDTAKLLRLLDELVVRPLMDAAVLLHNAPYLTRLHTTLRSGELPVERIDEDRFERELLTYGVPDPDLLIRTSGEQRISNFLLWQCAYAELVFVDTLWPDFAKEHLEQAIAEFRRRERRYGGVGG